MFFAIWAPQNHPNSPPDPDPAQKRLWEALGQPLEGLEEVWEGKKLDFDEKKRDFDENTLFFAQRSAPSQQIG